MSDKTIKQAEFIFQRRNDAHYQITETSVEQCIELYGESQFVALSKVVATAKKRPAQLTLSKEDLSYRMLINFINCL
jgi:hypothetical protein